jgi:alpha-ketoglutarate-dependent 2,4-dichlorophenoxyacetate dioxygenase
MLRIARTRCTASGARISQCCMHAEALTSLLLKVTFSASKKHQGESPMPVAIRQLHKHFVGEVSGVDLRKPLTKDEARDIEAGMDKYAVLVFHGQDITDDQQLAFSLNFGERENPRGGNIVKPEDSRLQTGLNDVSNLDRDGKPMKKDDRAHLFNLGNCLWHSDSSFRPIPAKFSLLSARVVNPKGGNTEFADMRAAYDALDDEQKAEIEDMICEHSLMYSRGSLGFLDYTDEEKQMFKPVLQRLVRTHPVHGRKSLYLSSHAGAIRGMSMPEARLLLRDLTEHATQPEFVYVHKWTLHDLVMWDNRQTMHRVRRYDQSQPRDMRRATVAGTAPTVAQEAAE